MIVHLHGPEPGSRHDAYLLERSGIVRDLHDKLVANGKRYVIYGDPAYGINDVIVAGFKGATLTQEQAEFNRRMSSVRVSVEWGFGIVLRLWPQVDYKSTQKLWACAVGKMYQVAVLLTNLHTCMRGGNQLSDTFQLAPPSPSAYLASRL